MDDQKEEIEDVYKRQEVHRLVGLTAKEDIKKILDE